MNKEEIEYNQLGDFDNTEFKNTLNIKLGPAMKIIKADKQYNSKERTFITSPGEFNKKMSARSSSTMLSAAFPVVPPPDHSTTFTRSNKDC